MDLSVITVTWNAEEHIAEQIRSVFSGCKNISCEEIVVDNGSTDKTVEIVFSGFPIKSGMTNTVKVIENKQNFGFGAANNRGVEISKGEFLLFLNPDMKVSLGSLDIIVKWMKDHPDAGIASVKLVDEQGQVNRDAMPRRFPKVWEQVALILKAPHIFPHMLHGYLMHHFDADKEQEVDSVRGSFMLMRRELIDKLGWAFDPRYFIWYEDVDICREAKRLGWKVMYTPVVSCIDYVGQAFKKQPTLLKQKRFTKSMLVYFQKWEPWWRWMWIAAARPIGIGMAYVSDFMQRKK